MALTSHILRNLNYPNPTCHLLRKHLSISNPSFLPPTVIMIFLPFDNNQQVFENPTPSSSTNGPKLIGHGKRPPSEPPPPVYKGLSYWVCAFSILSSIILVFCLVQWRVLFFCLGCFEYAFKVFDDMPQRDLDVVYVLLSENLSLVVAEQNLLSSQQMIPSRMVSSLILENQYNRIVLSKASPKAKDMIRI